VVKFKYFGMMLTNLNSLHEELRTGRKLHKELHNLYFSPNIVRVIRLRMMACGHRIQMQNACKTLVLRSKWKKLLRTPRNRLEDNIK
jgi:hypothetical protein